MFSRAVSLKPMGIHSVEKFCCDWEARCRANDGIYSTTRAVCCHNLSIVNPINDLGRRVYGHALEATAEGTRLYLRAVLDAVLVGAYVVGFRGS